MYKVGDAIVYSSKGIFTISDVKKVFFSGKREEYYILTPVFDNNSSVYVPTKNENLTSKMKPVLTKDKVMEVIIEAENKEANWIDDNDERNEEFSEVLTSGDRTRIMLMCKVLHNRKKELVSKGKHLRIADEQAYKNAKSLITNEFAYVLGILPDDVPEYISKVIEVS